jgi:hypothetical protein
MAVAIIPGLTGAGVLLRRAARPGGIPSAMDSPSLPLRALSALNRALHHLLFRFKQLLGIAAQTVQRDQLRELTDEARTLGSASAESINHVGAELREINARLAKLEREIERIGNRLETDGAIDPMLEKRGEEPAQSLSD